VKFELQRKQQLFKNYQQHPTRINFGTNRNSFIHFVVIPELRERNMNRSCATNGSGKSWVYCLGDRAILLTLPVNFESKENTATISCLCNIFVHSIQLLRSLLFTRMELCSIYYSAIVI
jgi:hypothetical protein